MLRKSRLFFIIIVTLALIVATTLSFSTSAAGIVAIPLTAGQLKTDLGIGDTTVSGAHTYYAYNYWQGPGIYFWAAAGVTTPYLTTETQMDNWCWICYQKPRVEANGTTQPMSPEIEALTVAQCAAIISGNYTTVSQVPAITIFQVSSTSLPFTGGNDTFTIAATNCTTGAITCAQMPNLQASSIGLSVGTVTYTIALPVNNTTAAESFVFVLTATGINGSTVTASLTVTVAGELVNPTIQTFTLTPLSLSSAGGTVTYAASALNATTGSIVFSPSVGGTTITGINLATSSATGSISMPANTGNATITYTATLTAAGQSGTTAATATATVTVAGVVQQLIINSSTPIPTAIPIECPFPGGPFSPTVTLTCTNGALVGNTWTYTGNLPTGVQFLVTSPLVSNSYVTLQGTPTVVGIYTFTIDVADPNSGATGSQTYTIDVSGGTQLANQGSTTNPSILQIVNGASSSGSSTNTHYVTMNYSGLGALNIPAAPTGWLCFLDYDNVSVQPVIASTGASDPNTTLLSIGVVPNLTDEQSAFQATVTTTMTNLVIGLIPYAGDIDAAVNAISTIYTAMPSTLNPIITFGDSTNSSGGENAMLPESLVVAYTSTNTTGITLMVSGYISYSYANFTAPANSTAPANGAFMANYLITAP
jgi:hypothetical protein